MSEHTTRPAIPAEASNGEASLAERVRALRLGDRVAGGKSAGPSTAWLPWVLCLLMAAAWVFLGSRWYNAGGLPNSPAPDAPAPAGDPSPGEGVPPPGEGARPAPRVASSGGTALTAKGYIIPAHQISISPIEVSGRVIELNFEEGREVEKGAVLARIDPTSFEADLLEAKAQRDMAKARYEELVQTIPEEITQAEAELAEAQAQLKQSELEYHRSRGLSGDALAVREYEQALYTWRANQQRVRKFEQSLALLRLRKDERIAAAKAEWDAAEARVVRAQFRYDNCWIRAPIRGTVLTKKAEEGNLVNPVVGGISTSLCDMADLSDLEVEIDVQEREVAKVFPGQRCVVTTDAYPGLRFDAYVDRMMPIANRAKGVLPIRVKVVIPPEEAGKLKPEMGVTVTFYNEEFLKPKSEAEIRNPKSE
ncbi:MAG TPA: efflux RND transporter periplasmic adaptor subunit, partial [Gemmataceae bacterium]